MAHEQAGLDFAATDDTPRSVALAGATLTFHPRAFPRALADRHFETLLAATPWRQDHITIHGRELPLPRLQAWYADGGEPLRYSGMTVPANPWTDALLAIRATVVALCGRPFSGVLVNCYRDGLDSVGWHSDDEPEWGPDPVIASVSLGATRDFMLRHRSDGHIPPVKIALTHGSLLVMGPGTQTAWQHQLPKRRRVTEPRINLTFRHLA